MATNFTHSSNESKEKRQSDIKNILQRLGAQANGKSIRFPVKLMCILNSNTHDDVCSWSPDGKSFVIFDQNDFVRDVLPIYFKGTKFSSFQRKLYRWGFTRQVDRSMLPNEYIHEKFQRNNLPLCQGMVCFKRDLSRSTSPTGIHSSEKIDGSTPEHQPLQSSPGAMLSFARRRQQRLRQKPYIQEHQSSSAPVVRSVDSSHNTLNAENALWCLQEGSRSTRPTTFASSAYDSRDILPRHLQQNSGSITASYDNVPGSFLASIQRRSANPMYEQHPSSSTTGLSLLISPQAPGAHSNRENDRLRECYNITLRQKQERLLLQRVSATYHNCSRPQDEQHHRFTCFPLVQQQGYEYFGQQRRMFSSRVDNSPNRSLQKPFPIDDRNSPPLSRGHFHYA